MWRKILVVVGIILLAIGLILHFLLSLTNRSAMEMDGVIASQAPALETMCSQVGIEADIEKRIMSEQESQLLQLFLRTESPTSCTAVVELNVVNFNVSPSGSQREVMLRPETTSALTWVISPQQTGQYTVAITVNDAIITLGITVTTVLGLTAAQAQVVSVVGTLLGPMLTIPWWYEQWQKRKKEKAEEAKRGQLEAKQADEGNSGRSQFE